MLPELWFRNFNKRAHLIAERGHNKLVWHRGTLIKSKIDPVAHARMTFPIGFPWRVLVVGVQGAVEYDQSSTDSSDIKACYPVWHYGDDDIESLEELVDKNVAEIPSWVHDPTVEPAFRPREGQEHRIVLINWPAANTALGKQWFRVVREIQGDRPDVIMHLFEATSFKYAFGLGFRAADLDPTFNARNKAIWLPNGRNVPVSELGERHQMWVNAMGLSINDLDNADNRVRFCVAAAIWANEFFLQDHSFKIHHPRVKAGKIIPTGAEAGPGDMLTCDTCSLADKCKYCRIGSICTLPGSETVDLSSKFKTRDADAVIDGLGEILALQAKRAQQGMEWEGEEEKLSGEVTKVLNSVMAGGAQLAKLIDPSLASPKIALQINQGAGSQAAVVNGNPKTMIANTIAALESRGIPRSMITKEMVFQEMSGEKVEMPKALEPAPATDADITDAELVEE